MVTSAITGFSKIYTGAVNVGAELAVSSLDTAISCADVMMTSTAGGVRNGVKSFFKSGIQWSLGVNDYKKAYQSLWTKQPIPLTVPYPNGFGPAHNGLFLVDVRPISKKVGESVGHVINGGCKVVATGAAATGAAAFVAGSLSNALTWSPNYQFGDFHRVARAFASGCSTLGSYLASFGWGATKLAARTTKAMASAAINHPRATFNTLGMGAALYLTTSSIVRAEKAHTPASKAAHIGLAAVGLGLMAAVPAINPLN